MISNGRTKNVANCEGWIEDGYDDEGRASTINRICVTFLASVEAEKVVSRDARLTSRPANITTEIVLWKVYLLVSLVLYIEEWPHGAVITAQDRFCSRSITFQSRSLMKGSSDIKKDWISVHFRATSTSETGKRCTTEELTRLVRLVAIIVHRHRHARSTQLIGWFLAACVRSKKGAKQASRWQQVERQRPTRSVDHRSPHNRRAANPPRQPSPRVSFVPARIALCLRARVDTAPPFRPCKAPPFTQLLLLVFVFYCTARILAWIDRMLYIGGF